jgi:hypothetical protein
MTNEEVWAAMYPDNKMPGNAEPVEGKCNAKVRDKRLKELGFVRHCNKTAGMGTNHLGEGTCKFHLGATLNHVKSAVRVQMGRELSTLSERLGEAAPIGPPEVEAWMLASKMKQWSLMMESKLDELNGAIETTDKAGVEHARALIEILERAWERFQSSLEFMMKYDLRKRVIELEEHQASLVGAAFMAIILSQDLKLSESQIDLARNLFATKMREMGPDIEPTWAANIVDITVVRKA